MSKKNFIEACVAASNCIMAQSRNEVNLFCEIMGLPKSNVNYFIGDDPHGVVDIMEGYYCFNMTDIHVVISEYEHWMEIYKTNEALARAVRQWYYWSLDWHQKHQRMEWIDAKKIKPEVDTNISTFTNVIGAIFDQIFECSYNPYNKKFWVYSSDGEAEADVDYWMKPTIPDDTYCPNLRAWLSGCPVPGLREATERYKAEQAKSLEESRKRTKEAQEAFDKCIAETKGE